MAYLEVLVFVQEGCPACHAVIPTVQQMMAHYHQCVSTRIVDANREGLLADRMHVQETPTVIGCVDFQPVVRLVAADDFPQRMVNLYGTLMQQGSCQVPTWRDV